MDELLDLLGQLGQLLADLEVGDHVVLVGDLDGVVALLQALHLCGGGGGWGRKGSDVIQRGPIRFNCTVGGHFSPRVTLLS